MNFLIYQIKNDVNSLLYIGITNQLLRARMLQHIGSARRGNQKPLYVAMRELGIEHFFIELLETCPARQQAECRETDLIETLGTAYPHGYNVRAPLTNEQVAIIRYNAYGWPLSRYAEEFHISQGTINRIRADLPWRIYRHVTRAHLPARAQAKAGK